MEKAIQDSEDTWQQKRPRIGISTCLLGESVRYDGQHKLDRFLRDTLGRYVEWVPVCPEVECGLSVPREPMHLEGDPDAPRLVTVRTGKDLTDQMLEYARRRVRELEDEDLCGFVFKSRSPSSGMTRIKVYDENGVPQKVGVGLFAGEFMDHFPLLPVEDDGRLHDPDLRENFIERIFCLERYRRQVKDDGGVAALVGFHAAQKMQLLAHHPEKLKTMGRLVARQDSTDEEEIFTRYEKLLMEALIERATPGKNANVLMHMMGYFNEDLSPDEKNELLEIISQYRRGDIPLVVPVTLVRHHVRKHREPYLKDQTYLNPHPIELKLRNHA